MPRSIPLSRYATVESLLPGCDDRTHNAWADPDLSRDERAIVDLLFGAQNPVTGEDALTMRALATLLDADYKATVDPLIASLIRLERIWIGPDGILHPLLLPVDDSVPETLEPEPVMDDPDPKETADVPVTLEDGHGELSALLAVEYSGVGGTGKRSVRTANLARFICAMRAAYPGVDLLAETRRALAWEVANPTQAKTAKGHSRFLRNWYERAQNQPGGRR